MYFYTHFTRRLGIIYSKNGLKEWRWGAAHTYLLFLFQNESVVHTSVCICVLTI